MNKLLTSLALGVAFAASASATVILSESFNYGLANDAALTGNWDSDGVTPGAQPTGTAPSGTWTEIHQTGSGLTFQTTGLSHSLISGSGGAVRTINSSASIGGTAATRSFDAAAIPTADGNVYWGRILINLNNTLPQASVGTPSTATGNSAGDAVRLFSNGGATGVGFEMYQSGGAAYTRATLGNGTTRVFGTETTVGIASTQLFVFKLTFGATDRVDIWLNPTSIAEESNLGTASSFVEGAASISNAALYLRRHAVGNSWLADEFVLGTSFADIAVSNVPEPSAFAALAGLGALGFAALRRRRA